MGPISAPITFLASWSRLFSVSLNYSSGLWFVFPINTHRHALMNQSEAHLHSGRSVHFRPSLSPRPSFRFSEGLVPRLLTRVQTVYGWTLNVTAMQLQYFIKCIPTVHDTTVYCLILVLLLKRMLKIQRLKPRRVNTVCVCTCVVCVCTCVMCVCVCMCVCVYVILTIPFVIWVARYK